MKKICFITGTRAEYGLLSPLIKIINSDNDMSAQLIITGSHLSPEFGFTKKKIDFSIVDSYEEIEILLSSDSAIGITKAMGLALISAGEVFKRLNPDLIIVIGDRYEMLPFVSAALICKIPIAHLHGGELTEGAFDDSIRHAITKMSHLHFTSSEIYSKRIIRMGEPPEHVYNVGAIGLDSIKAMDFLNKEQLENELDLKFARNNYLITYHPVTLENISTEKQLENLLNILDTLNDTMIIFTKANADTSGRKINMLLKEFVNKNFHKARLFDSLGTKRYLSVMKIVDAVVGNSSSGIIEAPFFNKPVIDIGDRQKGRLDSECIIHCGYSQDEINKAFKSLKSTEFINKLSKNVCPYGNGTAAEKIFQIIKNIEDFESLILKRFYE